jgi:hypothetical protein
LSFRMFSQKSQRFRVQMLNGRKRWFELSALGLHGRNPRTVHKAAGPDLQQECVRLPNKETGHVVITGAYQLSAKRAYSLLFPPHCSYFPPQYWFWCTLYIHSPTWTVFYSMNRTVVVQLWPHIVLRTL